MDGVLSTGVGWGEGGGGARAGRRRQMERSAREVESYRQGRNRVRSQKRVSMMQIQGGGDGGWGGGRWWTSNRVHGTINNRKPEGTIFSVLLLTWTG